MGVASADNIIASSGGQAIATLTNDLGTAPLDNANLVIGMSTTAINAPIAADRSLEAIDFDIPLSA